MQIQQNSSAKISLKIFARLCLFALLAFILIPSGCSSNPGIEVGNPTPGSPEELEGLEVTINPESADEPELYRVSVLSNTQAQLTKFGDITETLIVSILDAETGSFTVEATFNDGRVVTIIITFVDSTVTTASLSINGVIIPSSFVVTGSVTSATSCSTATTNAGLLVLEAICNQVTTCTSISCDECRTNMLAENDLSNELGLDEAFGTFQDIADAVDNGTIIANEPILEQCETAIGNTTCNDLDNIGFDENVGNYSQLEELLDLTPVCFNVF